MPIFFALVLNPARATRQMDFIAAQIAVGSRADAEDAATLAAHGIDTLLSLTPVARPAHVTRQLCLALQDRAAVPADVIAVAMDFLKQQAGRGRRVLMHCEMGISRSPALAACYLHETQGLSLAAALQYVQTRRPQAAPHPDLVGSLQAHYGAAAPIDLSANENPLGPSPRALAAIRGATDRLHRYPDKDGTALRQRLASELDLAAEQIVLGNGSCELIDGIARSCLGPGSEVLIPEPTFPAYRSAAARTGATVVAATMPGGRYDVAELTARLSAATRLVIVTSPHNPTGSLMRRADLARLQAALPPQAWLLLDEAYRDYAPAAELPDLLPAIRRREPVIVLRSFSKLHGLAGLRLGYAIAPQPMAQKLAGQSQQFNTSSLAQIAALAALDDAAHRQDSLANNARGLAELSRGMTRLGVEHLPSAANFVLLRAGAGAARAFAERGIAVKDMARYGLPEHVRVSVGRPADNARFLAALAEWTSARMNPAQSIRAQQEECIWQS